MREIEVRGERVVRALRTVFGFYQALVTHYLVKFLFHKTLINGSLSFLFFSFACDD